VTCASAHASVHGKRGGDGTDKAGPRRRDRKRDARGQRLGTGEPGPRDRQTERERERANGRRKLALTGWPHWAASEGGRARGRTAADRRGPPVRRRGRVGARAGWA
jgi:hypothetical protein